MVVIDATILMLLLRPGVGAPCGQDGLPIDRPIERLEFLVETLESSREKIVIPSPALSEILVRVVPNEAQKLVERISSKSIFRIEAFDARAAIEVAAMTRNAADRGLRPDDRDEASTYAKLKYDRQIVAVAIVTNSTAIYSDDRGLRAVAGRAGIRVIGLADLALPPEDAQIQMDFERRDEQPTEAAAPTAKDAEPVPIRSVSGDGSAG